MYAYSENARKRADELYAFGNGSVNERAHRRGMLNGEPLIVMMIAFTNTPSPTSNAMISPYRMIACWVTNG